MSVVDDVALHRSLLSSILDYLQRKGFEKTSKSLVKELKTAGWSVETSSCNLEDLWILNRGIGKEGLVLETMQGGVEGSNYKGSVTPSNSKLTSEEESSSKSGTTSTSTSSPETDSSRSSSPKKVASSSSSESSSSESVQSDSSNTTEESTSGSSSGRFSSSEESDSNHSSSTSSSTSEDSASSEESSDSSERESSTTTTTSEESRNGVSSSSRSSSTSSDSTSSDTQSSSNQKSSSSDSSVTSATSSSSTDSSEKEKNAENVSKAKEKEAAISTKRQREDSQKPKGKSCPSHDSPGIDVYYNTKLPSRKKSRTNAKYDFREDVSTSLTPQDSREAEETKRVSHSENSETLGSKSSPSEIIDEGNSVLHRFQRVQPDSVKFIDDKLRDNSYDAKGGEMYGLKAWEELKKVRGKDFRKAKTKKKRATYFGGGTISKDSHSFRFTYSDDSS
ncbi:hypothetical protein GpartN1_g3427.t1 [Galdieria partita]|uniref:Srp40 C-terminal domain-containing protein n=1 Tax=Galdieria partita TaxID=83374 RepID=A0A9C7UQG4_9RHOD|nr:hypothetical protein GpartN1_g3427.t1 [Galdieria partita]